MNEQTRLKEKARIAFHDKWEPDGNQLDGAFGEGFDAGYNARASQWVPVSERLPSDRKVYLVSTWFALPDDMQQCVNQAYLAEDMRTWISAQTFNPLGIVDAWMPEPEPYQPSTQDDDRQDQIAKTLISVLPKHGLSDCLPHRCSYCDKFAKRH